MKKWKSVIIFILIAMIASSSIVLANNLPFEDYKLAVRALKDQDWEQAENYLDSVILGDLSYSNYLAKSIYLKTIILAAKIDKDVLLKDSFLLGSRNLDVEEEELREDFKVKINNYKLTAKRQVDTLIGLSNYLVANIPPVEVGVNNLYNTGTYDQDLITAIQSGIMVGQGELKGLEEDILARKINKYLGLTLGIRSNILEDVFVVRAEKGDNLYQTAKRYEVPVQLLIRVNSHISNPDKIYPGEKIYIPKVDNSYIDYPAYFYYISSLAYQANQERKDDIARLVAKAYQLTNNDGNVDVGSQALLSKIEADRYKEYITQHSDEIKEQTEELSELKKRYKKLLEELEKLSKEDDEETNNSLENNRGNNYNPDQDPLQY